MRQQCRNSQRPNDRDRRAREHTCVSSRPLFHGLFMGVNRHASSAISELRFAETDATALHALFADTLGDDSELLVGEDVTRDAVASRLERLAECRNDDVVVMTFSGHGSETHELVTYDA